MAIDKGEEAVTIRTEERTWRIQIETPKGLDPNVTVFRETVRSLPDGTIISKEATEEVRRSFSSISEQKFDIRGMAITGAQVAGILAAVADIWRQEDLKAVQAEGKTR